jgi:Outer membrane protein beta-barrel domain
MKKLSVIVLTFLVSTSAYAQRGSVRSSNDFSSSMSGTSVTGYLGFGQGALNIGADFEAAMSSDAGVGGYFMLLTDAERNNATIRSQVIAFGAQAKVHYRPGDWDFYGTPGFGIAMIDNNTNDETTFGPSMRIGVLYALTPTLSVGIEHATLFNWFSKDVGAESLETSNAAFRMSF